MPNPITTLSVVWIINQSIPYHYAYSCDMMSIIKTCYEKKSWIINHSELWITHTFNFSIQNSFTNAFTPKYVKSKIVIPLIRHYCLLMCNNANSTPSLVVSLCLINYSRKGWEVCRGCFCRTSCNLQGPRQGGHTKPIDGKNDYYSCKSSCLQRRSFPSFRRTPLKS